MEGVYVQPKTDCPHVGSCDIQNIISRFTSETYNKPCGICHDLTENWFCLSCENVFCSRFVQGHMADHNCATNHPCALSFSDASVWCYECDSYITSPQLTKLTRHFGDVKFGPNTSTSSCAANAATLETVQEEDEAEENDPENQEHTLENEEFSREDLISGLKDKSFKKIVVLTGAGISVAAGIPDFRSPKTGLYSRLQELGLPFAEAVFQLDYFRENPRPFYEVAKWFLTLEGKPTKAHKFIKYLHDNEQLLLNCTQNIDGLEIEAGLPESILTQAHGHMRTAHCIDCKKEYPVAAFFEALQNGVIYTCPVCKETKDDQDSAGLIKPDIVFFGEPLPKSFKKATETVGEADLVIVMGTSLKVYPFAYLADPLFCPEHIPLVLINRENPGLFRKRMLFLEGDIETLVQSIADELNVTL